VGTALKKDFESMVHEIFLKVENKLSEAWKFLNLKKKVIYYRKKVLMALN